MYIDDDDNPIPILTTPPMDGDWAGPSCGGYGCPTFTPPPADAVVPATRAPHPVTAGPAYFTVGLSLIVIGLCLAGVLVAARLLGRRRQ